MGGLLAARALTSVCLCGKCGYGNPFPTMNRGRVTGPGGRCVCTAPNCHTTWHKPVPLSRLPQPCGATVLRNSQSLAEAAVTSRFGNVDCRISCDVDR